MKNSGSCLCNKVTFTTESPYSRFAICYCSRCRKVTGSAHASNLFANANQIEWLSGADNVTRFEYPEAERFSKTFCKTCGSPVPCLSRDGTKIVIPAGSLDSDPGANPDVKIYSADKAHWYQNLESIPEFDGPPK